MIKGDGWDVLSPIRTNKLLFQVRFQQIQVGPQFFGQIFISLNGISIMLRRLKVVMSDLDLFSHVRYPDIVQLLISETNINQYPIYLVMKLTFWLRFRL